jgi:hypothetical protein
MIFPFSVETNDNLPYLLKIKWSYLHSEVCAAGGAALGLLPDVADLLRVLLVLGGVELGVAAQRLQVGPAAVHVAAQQRHVAGQSGHGLRVHVAGVVAGGELGLDLGADLLHGALQPLHRQVVVALLVVGRVAGAVLAHLVPRNTWQNQTISEKFTK